MPKISIVHNGSLENVSLEGIPMAMPDSGLNYIPVYTQSEWDALTKYPGLIGIVIPDPTTTQTETQAAMLDYEIPSGGVLTVVDNKKNDVYLVPKSSIDIIESAMKSINSAISQITQNFNTHVREDFNRWQQFADVMTALRADFVKIAKQVYESTVPDIDTDHPTQIFGTKGLLTLGGTGSYDIPENGWIIVSYSAILGTAPILYIDGYNRLWWIIASGKFCHIGNTSFIGSSYHCNRCIRAWFKF